MGKLLAFFLVMFLFIQTPAQYKFDRRPEKYPGELKGNVREVFEKIIYSYEEEGRSPDTITVKYEFDKAGNLLSKRRNSISAERDMFDYSGNNVVKRWRNFQSKDYRSLTEYTYNYEDGRLASVIGSDGSKEIFEYDKKGRLAKIKKEFEGSPSELLFEHYENGKLKSIRQKSYSSVFLSEFEYSADGFTRTDKLFETDVIMGTSVYSYTNGLLTKSKTEDYDSSIGEWIISEADYKYEFDNLGNWIYQKFTNFDMTTETRREIKYFN